jgi:C_GCAxxG_C_C family probable redox protein
MFVPRVAWSEKSDRGRNRVARRGRPGKGKEETLEESDVLVVEEAYRLAKEYEATCTGCAQSVVAGLLDAMGIQEEGVFKAASGLADGIGLTGDGSCGALTGGCMVLGLLFGRERKDHRDMMKPMRSYLLCKELHDFFVVNYGSARCHDIQERLMGRTYDLYDPQQLQEAFRSGMLEHCSEVVGRAARKAAELIIEEREKQEPDEQGA